MAEPIISVSGLRGVVGESLDPVLASRFVAAFAAEIPAGAIVVTRDGRATGRMLADAISASLRAVGRDVVDADVAATPTTGVLVRDLGAAGGVQISASHNPPEYNGIKLFDGRGRVIPADAGQRVIEQYRSAATHWVRHDAVGGAAVCGDTTAAHLEKVLACVDVERIRAARYRVMLDANHGAGSVLGRPLLDALGCDVIVLGGDSDGKFAHPPEPTADNLADVLEQVTAAGAAIGFCQDPDADRLAVIDEAGRYLGEEYTLAMCVDHVLRQRAGAVVTNCSTSRMSEDLAAKYDVPFYRSKVGEANVCDVMIEHDAVIGGEGNGGVIDPRVGYVRDSFVGMALLLDAMARRDVPVSRLADELPRYEIVKTKFTVDAAKVSALLDELERSQVDAAADRMDGLRLDWPGKWLLVRASNTEPIVRAIAEAPDRCEAERLCHAVEEALAAL
ncbi:MAG: phosphoglucosamine mutase [Planctomycetales bacterium]|nr:phosphoglucosamine mutase [Planctomycetales bacterium]